jgi:hypothetical protein
MSSKPKIFITSTAREVNDDKGRGFGFILIFFTEIGFTVNITLMTRIIDDDYKKWILEIKSKIRSAQMKAVLSVNAALIEFY